MKKKVRKILTEVNLVPRAFSRQGREDPGVGWSNNGFDWLTSY
jgi:hypothetical protein